MIKSIATEQFVQSLLAIPAFLPLTVCPGYLAAWYTELQGFRQRSLVERLFWSVPLSLSISPIAAVLICRFFSGNCRLVLPLLRCGLHGYSKHGMASIAEKKSEVAYRRQPFGRNGFDLCDRLGLGWNFVFD